MDQLPICKSSSLCLPCPNSYLFGSMQSTHNAKHPLYMRTTPGNQNLVEIVMKHEYMTLCVIIHWLKVWVVDMECDG